MNSALWLPPLLLAQQTATTSHYAAPSTQSFLFPGVAMITSFIFIGLMVWWGIRYSQVVRQMEHAERMRALELGQRLPKDTPWWSPAKVAVAIGAGVPAVAFSAALKATSEPGIHPEVAWLSAGGVGIVAVICGTCLALRAREPISTPATYQMCKPPVDPIEHEFSA